MNRTSLTTKFKLYFRILGVAWNIRRRADKILVVNEGKIIEQGSHKELMKQKGLYNELFTKQAEGYRE